MAIVRPALDTDLVSATRVMVSAMASSPDYNFPEPEEIFEHWKFRVSGYFGGTYHPGGALSERAMFVAAEDGAVAGMIAGHRTTRMDADAELQWAFVHPDLQRRGIGGQMLGELRAWFVSNGFRKVIVNASADMATRSFYLRHGAVPLNEHWVVWEDIGLGQRASDRL